MSLNKKVKKIFVLTTGLTVGIFILYLLIFGIYSLKMKNNETYFKTEYITESGLKIYIPKYLAFKEECCMTAAIFHSLVPKFILENQIEKYMSEFTYFESDGIRGYQNGDLFIQNYEVKNHLLYREIVIVY